MAEKVYIVTGASAGIGVGIAEALTAAGARKLVLVARRKEKMEKVAADCRAKGADEVLVIQADLSDFDSCPRVVKETMDKFGRE